MKQFPRFRRQGFFLIFTAAARAYLLNHYLRSLLWMEYSPEAEAALRQTLTTTKFLF